jgi:hypothetical protein
MIQSLAFFGVLGVAVSVKVKGWASPSAFSIKLGGSVLGEKREVSLLTPLRGAFSYCTVALYSSSFSLELATAASKASLGVPILPVKKSSIALTTS